MDVQRTNKTGKLHRLSEQKALGSMNSHFVVSLYSTWHSEALIHGGTRQKITEAQKHAIIH